MQEALRAGDRIVVEVQHADGQPYRRWDATVEQVSEECLVTLSSPGQEIWDRVKGNWTSRRYIRAYYWFGQHYNLLEVYRPDRAFEELYINIAGPPVLDGQTLRWVDHELDVSMLKGGPARIVDEEEFVDAALRYAYSSEFQARCRALARQAVQIAEGWVPAGISTTDN